MDHEYIERRLKLCCEHLEIRGITYGQPQRHRGDPPKVVPKIGVKNQHREKSNKAVFFVPLTGKLEIFDIALLDNGMTALREINPDDFTRKILFEQAIPEFIVDIAKDLEAGYSCSHLQTR